MKIRISTLMIAVLFLFAAEGMSQAKKNTSTAQKAKPPAKAPAPAPTIPELILQGRIPEALKLAQKSPLAAESAINSLLATADTQVALRKSEDARATLDAAQKFVDALAKTGGVKELQRDALNGRRARMEGIELNNRQDYAKAESSLKLALQISRNIKDPLLEAGVHNNLGYALQHMELPEEAAREYEMASQMAEEQKDDLRGCTYNFNFGLIMQRLKRWDAAMRAFKRAAEQGKAASQFDIQARATLLQAVVAGSMDIRNPDAIKLYLEAESMFEKLGDNQNVGWSYYRLGDFIAYSMDFKKAAEYGEKGLPFLLKAGDKAGLQACYEFLAEIYGKLGDIKKAEGYTNLAKDIATRKTN